MLDVVVFTSMDRKYFDLVGHTMIRSFIYNWPSEIPLHIYWEGMEEIPDFSGEHRFVVHDLELETNLNHFRERNKNRPGQSNPKELHRGAIRFAPKAYSIIHMLQNRIKGYSIWLDADVYTHSPIDNNLLHDVCRSTSSLTYLGRENNYTETGFIVFNNQHPLTKVFSEEYTRFYEEDKLFNLPQWHDCIPFDVARRKAGCTNNYNLSKGGSGYEHVFIQSVLGKYMDHMKGPRKERGHSDPSETNHTNVKYWDSL